MLLHFVIMISGIGGSAPKPIEKMTFGELLTEGMDSVNNIAKEPSMPINPHVVKLREILMALSKSTPLVNYEESLSGAERQADKVIHDLFHPIESAENGLHGAYWDSQHLTSERSAFNLLSGILICISLYIMVGACIMAKYYNAQGVDRIPHLSLWMAYPGLVVDGIIFVADQIGFDTSSGTYQRLHVLTNNKSAGSRDTFSQFEPI